MWCLCTMGGQGNGCRPLELSQTCSIVAKEPHSTGCVPDWRHYIRGLKYGGCLMASSSISTTTVSSEAVASRRSSWIYPPRRCNGDQSAKHHRISGVENLQEPHWLFVNGATAYSWSNDGSNPLGVITNCLPRWLNSEQLLRDV